MGIKRGAPEMIRTSDPKIRNLVLYPAELRARHDCYNHEIAPAQELNLKKNRLKNQSPLCGNTINIILSNGLGCNEGGCTLSDQIYGN